MTQIQKFSSPSPSPHWGEGWGEGNNCFGHLELEFGIHLGFGNWNLRRFGNVKSYLFLILMD